MRFGSSKASTSSDDLLARAVHHFDRQGDKDDPAGDRDGATGDVKKAHQQGAKGKHDERGYDRCPNHLPAYGPLRLGVELLGFFEEGHEGDLGTHADQQKKKQLGYECDRDYREIHPALALLGQAFAFD